MALSDCPKCWDTPCGCGYMYEDWSKLRLNRQIAMLTEVLQKKEALPKKKKKKKSPFCPECHRNTKAPLFDGCMNTDCPYGYKPCL